MENDGKLYYRINSPHRNQSTGVGEILEDTVVPHTRFANELRLGVRDNYTLDQVLEASVMLSEVETAIKYWTPTPEQNAELILIEDLDIKTARSNELFLQWRQARLDENARRKALNEVAKTRIDLERGDTINNIMGQILEKYQVNPDNVENDEESQNLEEARERGDWLFIFEAARDTHMFQSATTDRVLYEKQEQEKDHLSKMKHVSGDFNRWITRSRPAKLPESNSPRKLRSFIS